MKIWLIFIPELAKSCFLDIDARLIADPDHSLYEDRFLLLGFCADSRLLLVSHCVREKDTIRIISARKADKQERRIYEDCKYA